MAPYLSEPLVEHDAENTSGLKAMFPHLTADPASLPASADPFTITISTGFMPFHTPVRTLPSAFAPMMSLVEQMPITKLDGSPGLLASYQLGPTIDKGDILPDLTSEIDKLVAQDGQPDLASVTAAFRDYSFLASAYLLEPCWERWSNGHGGYGLGRDFLPVCIAGPLVKTAKILDIPPFMAYAAAYSSYNFCYEDPAIGVSQYGNLRLVRAFEHGLDPKSSEAGFVLTHVDMIKHTGALVAGAVDLLDGVAAGDNCEVISGFNTMLEAMQVIEASMETMWQNSKPKDYNSYRTFIFGITNQSMFPHGVTYENHNNNRPWHFRGESGSNDCIIPLCDALCEIPMPSNPLTDILKEFRAYRPAPHRSFLAAVRESATQLKVRSAAISNPETAVLYLRLLDHVRSFRWRHWLFAREYILKRSSHPTATGGSPIVTWLPNQLTAVMDLMWETWMGLGQETREAQPKFVREMMERAVEQRETLRKEVEKWCQERGV